MAGKPGAAAAEDDDLIVDLEVGDTDYAPTEEEGVEDFKQPALEAETLPEGEEEGVEGDPQPRQRQAEAEEETHDDSYERLTAAEEAARNERAGRIWDKALHDADLNDAQINNAKAGLRMLDDKLELAMNQIAAAKEGGDIRTELQIQASIDEMRKLKGEIETGLSSLPSREQILSHGRGNAQKVLDTQQASGKSVGSGIVARHPLAERWAGANGWMKVNKSANNFVIKQSEAMTRDGYDPNSPGFYAELTRRVKNAYPNLKVEALQAQKRAPGKASQMQRSPVAPARSASGQGAVSNVNGKTRYTLSVSEQRKMQRFNLDPQNPQHRKAWAKSRLDSARRERAPAQ